MYHRLAFVFLLNVRLNFALILANFQRGENFSQWTEDNLIETSFDINKKFMFDNQQYKNIILRTGLNEWSFELSDGNGSHSNRLWTEFHLYLPPHESKSFFNNSIRDTMINYCYSPIISPLTNNSNFSVPELYKMDQRIGNYFHDNGFFRTINYIQCSMIEERHNASLRIHLDIYFVTNRQFQSLLFIEMLNTTKDFFEIHQAKFFLHNSQRKFRLNYNISNINSIDNSSSKIIWMAKLYNENKPKPSSSVILQINFLVLFICLLYNT